jgi:hypothetical protein
LPGLGESYGELNRVSWSKYAKGQILSLPLKTKNGDADDYKTIGTFPEVPDSKKNVPATSGGDTFTPLPAPPEPVRVLERPFS